MGTVGGPGRPGCAGILAAIGTAGCAGIPGGVETGTGIGTAGCAGTATGVGAVAGVGTTGLTGIADKGEPRVATRVGLSDAFTSIGDTDVPAGTGMDNHGSSVSEPAGCSTGGTTPATGDDDLSGSPGSEPSSPPFPKASF